MDIKNTLPLLTAFSVASLMISNAGGATLYWLESDSSHSLLIKANPAGEMRDTLRLFAGSLPQAIVYNPDMKKLFWTELLTSGAHIRTVNADFSNSGSLALEYEDYRAPGGAPKRADMIFRLLSLQSCLTGIAFDHTSGKIYWTATNPAIGQGIFRANIDGSSAELLLYFNPSSANSPRAIAIDEKAHMMYWTNSGARAIQRASTVMETATAPRDIVSGLGAPVGIAIDPDSGTLFWSDTAANAIGTAKLDGTGAKTIITGLRKPGYMCLDPINRKLYWSEIGVSAIRSANFDGSDTTTVLHTASAPSGITVAGDSPEGTFEKAPLPQTYEMPEISPNPIKRSALVLYRLTERSHVRISLFNLLSRKVRILTDETVDPGLRRVEINSSGLAPGVYYLGFEAGRFTGIKKCAVAR